MRGVHIFEKPCCREIRVMRGRAMRGLPVYIPIRIANKIRWKGPPGFIKLPLENGMRRRDPKTKTLFWWKR